MSARNYIGKPGIRSGVWIDGDYKHVGPKVWTINSTLRQAVFEAMNATQIVTGAYDGDGLPAVLDNFTFEFPFDLDSNFEDLAAALETLRTAGGVHTLAFQKAFLYTYNLRAGQTMFWMRGDAAAQGFISFDDPDLTANVVIPDSSEPAPTTVYKTTVSTGDSVPADEVWISKQVSRHPSGKYLAFCKLGTAPSTRAAMTVASFQLFRVVVTGLPRQYPHAAMEAATLLCAETN